MTFGIEIAPTTASAPRLTQAGAISLPGLSALPGFASLLNGLLDQNANAITTTSAGRQSNAARSAPFSFGPQNRGTTAPQTAAETGNATPSTKQAQRKTGAAAGPLKEATVHRAETQTLLPVAVWEQTGSLPLSEPGGKDVASIVTGRASTAPPSTPSLPSQPAPSALLPASSAFALFTEMSLPKSILDNTPATGDLAFALQLSWQPSSVHAGAALPAISAATAPQAPEASLPSAAGVAAGGPQPEPRSPAEEQPSRATQSAQSTRSADASAPIRWELVPQARSEALFQRFSSTRVSSPSETAALAKSALQTAGPNTISQAASASTNGEVQAQPEDATRLPERVPNNTGARTDDRSLGQDPAELASPPSADKAMPSTSPVAFGGDKPASGTPHLLPGNAQVSNAPATHPAMGPSGGDSESAAAADTGTKPGAKALGNLPAQKLSPSPGSHESPGTSADGVLLGRSAEPAGTPGGRTKAAASETPQARTPIEAAPTPPAPSIREVSIRLGAATSTPVDVQLAAKAGKVQVAVRTPDLDLAKSLQTNLGELVGRLEEKGFKTEAWTPQTTVHTGLAVRQPATSTANQGHSDQSGSPGGQPDARGGQRQSGQRQQGRWEAEFEETLSAPDANPTAGD